MAHTDISLDDVWKLDLKKLDGWQCLAANSAGLHPVGLCCSFVSTLECGCSQPSCTAHELNSSLSQERRYFSLSLVGRQMMVNQMMGLMAKVQRMWQLAQKTQHHLVMMHESMTIIICPLVLGRHVHSNLQVHNRDLAAKES